MGPEDLGAEVALFAGRLPEGIEPGRRRRRFRANRRPARFPCRASARFPAWTAARRRAKTENPKARRGVFAVAPLEREGRARVEEVHARVKKKNLSPCMYCSLHKFCEPSSISSSDSLVPHSSHASARLRDDVGSARGRAHARHDATARWSARFSPARMGPRGGNKVRRSRTRVRGRRRSALHSRAWADRRPFPILPRRLQTARWCSRRCTAHAPCSRARKTPNAWSTEVVCRPASGLQSASPRRRLDSAAAAENARVSRSSPTAHHPVASRRSLAGRTGAFEDGFHTSRASDNTFASPPDPPTRPSLGGARAGARRAPGAAAGGARAKHPRPRVARRVAACLRGRRRRGVRDERGVCGDHGCGGAVPRRPLRRGVVLDERQRGDARRGGPHRGGTERLRNQTVASFCFS